MISLQNKFNRNIFTESIIDEEKSKSSSPERISNSLQGKSSSSQVAIASTMAIECSNGTISNGNSSSSAVTSAGNKRIKQLEKILSSKMININELKLFAWNGVPFGISLINYIENPIYRAEVWKYLLGYYPVNTDLKESLVKRKRQEYLQTCVIYESLLENPMKTMNDAEMKIYKQISVDVPRTMPEYKIFSIERIRSMMTRILFVWSMRHPASGYVQGFNDLCTPFIVIFISPYLPTAELEAICDINETQLDEMGDEALLEIENDTYWCFTKMLDRIQTNYTHNQPGLTKMIQKMEQIILLVDEELSNHLAQFEISFMQFSFRWMNCYLMREFSLKLIIRIWDTYFSEEDAFNSFHLYVSACLLLSFSEKIKKMTEFQETMMFLQNMKLNNWSLEEINILLAKAYQVSEMYGKFLKEK